MAKRTVTLDELRAALKDKTIRELESQLITLAKLANTPVSKEKRDRIGVLYNLIRDEIGLRKAPENR